MGTYISRLKNVIMQCITPAEQVEFDNNKPKNDTEEALKSAQEQKRASDMQDIQLGGKIQNQLRTKTFPQYSLPTRQEKPLSSNQNPNKNIQPNPNANNLPQINNLSDQLSGEIPRNQNRRQQQSTHQKLLQQNSNLPPRSINNEYYGASKEYSNHSSIFDRANPVSAPPPSQSQKIKPSQNQKTQALSNQKSTNQKNQPNSLLPLQSNYENLFNEKYERIISLKRQQKIDKLFQLGNEAREKGSKQISKKLSQQLSAKCLMEIKKMVDPRTSLQQKLNIPETQYETLAILYAQLALCTIYDIQYSKESLQIYKYLPTNYFFEEIITVHNNLGFIYATKGNYQAAISEFQEALQLQNIFYSQKDERTLATAANLKSARQKLK